MIESRKQSASCNERDQEPPSPKLAEQESKEALFERVERKEEKKEESEDLEVQDISVDDL